MGQIVSSAAKPKRCNLNKLSQLRTPAAGEYILVSSDNSMTANGQGYFDCYVIGEGNKAASQLPLHRIEGKSMQYKLLDVNWVKDHYVNASNTLVSYANWWGALNVDVFGYDKIEAYVTALGSGVIVILDENMSVLSTMTGTRPTIDLTRYPTAKYMSFTNYDSKNSMQIFGIKSSNTLISDAFAHYKAKIGDRDEVYPNATSDNIFVYPSINTTGYIDDKNKVKSGGRHTDYIVIPQKASYIYYSGKSIGSATAVVFYDSYKNYLSHVANSVNADAYNVEFAVPSNAVYARVSSMSKLLDFYFDVMPQIVLRASSGKATIMRQINVDWTTGGYINASNEVVSSSDYLYVQNFDISSYAGKKIIARVGAYSGERNLMLDENYNILYSGRGDLEVNLADYPTAKYISLSKYLYRNSGEVFVEEESEKTIEDIVADLYAAFGDSGAEYANEIANEFYIEPVADISGYYLTDYNAPKEFAGAKYSSKYYRIPPVATKVYYTGVSYGGIQSVLFFDKYKKYISSVVSGTNSLPVSNIEIPIPDGAVYIRFSSGSSICTITYDKPANKVGGGGSGSGSETTNLSNYLYGKKYFAIGDSFTYPIDEVIEDGPLAGFSMVYPYIIGNRNNMTVVNQAGSGSTLRWYLTSSKYNDIDSDVDYITIWYGINENAQNVPIGTVDEQPTSITNDSTMCGCFNWLFKWLLVNRPLAKVGVIITDYASEERRQAIIGCCKRWGFAYLDIMGNPTIPMFTGGRDSDIQVDPEAISLRSQVFCKNYPGDVHPNYKMHQWQSTIIENFMRSL